MTQNSSLNKLKKIKRSQNTILLINRNIVRELQLLFRDILDVYIVNPNQNKIKKIRKQQRNSLQFLIQYPKDSRSLIVMSLKIVKVDQIVICSYKSQFVMCGMQK
ncbi:unnamed protein product [Paramecium sonneborni]|uniref:Uncharacterized protein n=1 Tax=Paramecium sonneborni TaxID=65129 RepID=A0A8S1P810_9CILI|nr:unnamed protein product [Paramecium sonneborni]